MKKIGILSRGSSLYSTTRIEQAALKRGHRVRVIDYSRCVLTVGPDGAQVLYQGDTLDFDYVIPRVGASQTYLGTAVVRHFEAMGIRCLNGSDAIWNSRDKLTAMQIMARAGIPMPRTSFASHPRDTSLMIDGVGGAPVVVKLTESTQGSGVMLADTRQTADSMVSSMRAVNAQLVVQEFIAEARGADIRAFVVGNQVVAAMVRQAADGEFRANLHLGGCASRIRLTRDERDIAVRAARATGLQVAGVDILRSTRGPLVLEVNSSPGLEGIEDTTGVDVAERIMEFVERGELEPSDDVLGEGNPGSSAAH
jgi:ribosomal protein S6--L-glutamate ligase